MKGSIADASKSETGRKKVKPKVLKESALAAGLEALAALESSDIAPRPVQATARTFVMEGIETILRLREKGVPLLRIYTDARKAAGLRIGYPTFAGYVSEIAKERGLRPAKVKTEAAPTPASATVETSTAASSADGWGCARCETESERRESTKKTGAFFWKCPGCGSFHEDDDGRISQKRLG